jgi:ribosome-binding protein aMBF1 (putative translation factor)
LNEAVDEEVEALPEDMRARLARIAAFIEEKGLERVGGTAREACRRSSVGDAAEGQQRNFACSVRDGRGPARFNCPGFREEDGEDAAARDRDGLVSREIGSIKGGVAMARISDMHKSWMREPKYRKAYAALEEEFVLASAVMDVRNRAGLTQEELARKMGTTQPVVARLESGRTRPSMRTLQRLAEATGSRLLISFEPLDAKRPAL